MKTEADNVVMPPQTKKCQELPEAERGKEKFSCRVFVKQCSPADTLL